MQNVWDWTNSYTQKKNQVNLLQLKNILKGKRTCSKLNSIKTDRKTK